MELDEAISAGLDLLQQLIRIDTSVQAGREVVAARLLHKQCQEHGLSGQIFEPAFGKGSFLARLPGAEQPSLLLLSHLDTAPLGESGEWEYPSLSGEIAGGQVWGRGTVDCKGLVAVWFAVMLMLRDTPLRRGIVFLAAADEESGGQWGVGWLTKHVPELRHCRWVLSEGGGWQTVFRGKAAVTCQTGEKGRLLLRLPVAPKWKTANEPFGIASRLPPSTVHLLQQATGLPRSVAQHMRGEVARAVLALAQNRAVYAIDPFEQVFHIGSVRGVSGSVLELSAGILPGYRLCDIVNTIANRYSIDPEQIETCIQVEPTESSLNSELYRAICQTCPVAVCPIVTPSYSDNRWFRGIGADVYGYFPGVDACEISRQHEANERLSIGAFRAATATLCALVRSFCTVL